MDKVVFDFNHIPDVPQFYGDFAQQFSLGTGFAANLDALWTAVTDDISLPVEIEFVNFGIHKRRRFGAVVLLFEEAEEELEGRLRFNIR